MEEHAVYGTLPEGSIREVCLKPFLEWEIPTAQEVRIAMKLAKLTGSELGSLVGVKNSRTVRRWTSGDVEIPYSAWALLCFCAELGTIWVKKQNTK